MWVVYFFIGALVLIINFILISRIAFTYLEDAAETGVNKLAEKQVQLEVQNK